MTEIRTIRERLRLTQAEFARRMGVSQSLVSRWESEEITPSTRDINAARYLLVDPEMREAS